MTIQSLNALNLSVANAEKFVASVKDNSRILSFFVGGDSVETDSNLNTDQRRSTAFKDASIIRRVAPASVNVVIDNIRWVRGQVYNKWNSKNPPINPITKPRICFLVKNKLKKNTPTTNVEIGVSVVNIDAKPLSI